MKWTVPTRPWRRGFALWPLRIPTSNFEVDVVIWLQWYWVRDNGCGGNQYSLENPARDEESPP